VLVAYGFMWLVCWPPYWLVLSRSDCFSQCECVGLEVLYDCLPLSNLRTTRWFVPVYQWDAVKTIFVSIVIHSTEMCPNRKKDAMLVLSKWGEFVEIIAALKWTDGVDWCREEVNLDRLGFTQSNSFCVRANLASDQRLCIFGPKGAIQICY